MSPSEIRMYPIGWMQSRGQMADQPKLIPCNKFRQASLPEKHARKGLQELLTCLHVKTTSRAATVSKHLRNHLDWKTSSPDGPPR